MNSSEMPDLTDGKHRLLCTFPSGALINDFCPATCFAPKPGRLGLSIANKHHLSHWGDFNDHLDPGTVRWHKQGNPVDPILHRDKGNEISFAWVWLLFVTCPLQIVPARLFKLCSSCDNITAVKGVRITGWGDRVHRAVRSGQELVTVSACREGNDVKCPGFLTVSREKVVQMVHLCVNP